MIGWLAQSHSLPMQYLYLLVIVRIAADHGGRVGSRNEPAVGRPVPSARQRLCSPGRDCRPRDRRVTRAADSKVVRLFSCCSYWYVGVPLGVHPLCGVASSRSCALHLSDCAQVNGRRRWTALRICPSLRQRCFPIRELPALQLLMCTCWLGASWRSLQLVADTPLIGCPSTRWHPTAGTPQRIV